MSQGVDTRLCLPKTAWPPTSKEFNAGLLGLTIDEKGIPDSVQARTEIGLKILAAAMEAGIPTDDIRLEQKAEFDEKGTLAKVTIDVHVPESFPQKYLAAVQAVAEKCAVKRAFEARPPIVVKTVQEGTPEVRA